MNPPVALVKQIEDLFPSNTRPDLMTLEQGDEIDRYAPPTETRAPAPFTDWLSVPDSYLEAHQWGMIYLDTDAWLFYVPRFMVYALEHCEDASLVVSASIQTFRPPDTEKPHLRALNERQKDAVRSFLEFMAFDPASASQVDALQVLEEYWIGNPLYPNRKI